MTPTMKELGKQHELIAKMQCNLDSMQQQSKAIQAYLELTDELAKEQADLKANTTALAETINTWMPDRFSKGTKDMVRDGTNILLRSKRTVRTILPKMFIDLYPFEANVMIETGKIKIPVGIVEAEIGKAKTNAICSADVTYSYEFQSRAYEPLKQEEPKDEPKPEVAKAQSKPRRKVKVNA